MSPSTPEPEQLRPFPRGSDRSFGRPAVFLPTGDEAARFDRRAIEEFGVPAAVLMENAGRGAALVLDRLWPRGRVLVAVGSGNNGGDGVVLARTLFAQGRHVEILLVGDRPDPDPLLHGWPVPVRRVPDDPALLYGLLTEAAVLVDALLGTGVSGAPRPPYDRVIRGINRVDRPRMALDVPTGVDSASGAVPGEAVQAGLTVAFGDPKLGTMLFPGRAHAGRLVAVEIGFPPSTSAASRSERDSEELGGSPPGKARLITGGWARANRPVRSLVTHKKAAGHLLVVAGSGGMAGAAIL
ncbi:MAG: NAD(P)H-hydrate epimerase, partial [Gemmatimonadota bacterium]